MSYLEFKESIKSFATQDLGSLYLSYRGRHEASSYMIRTMAISFLVLSILPVLSGSFVVAFGLLILSIALGLYSHLRIHKNDLEKKIIEDLFRERGKCAIFQVYKAGFGGYSLKIIDINAK